ncbi:unnamed protein product [Dibothriocephalus latus]|uniref:DUF3719 domain-containing protein n=1 Tax=Dibothriocephalus latus TaxID=60516 RepID=A0A3P6UV94_DIBLA|nr:unnamed protein product [Dibothriocephalus latus]
MVTIVNNVDIILYNGITSFFLSTLCPFTQTLLKQLMTFACDYFLQEFDKEESYRVQQMFDAIDTILYETDDMLLGESKFRTQKSNKRSTSPLGTKVLKVSQYLGQNNGVPLDPAIKELSCAPHKQMNALQGSARPIQMLPGVEHLLPECKEWAEKFPHLRIRGAGIKKAERTSTVAKKAITFTLETSSKANIGKVTMPEIPDLHRSGYVVEGSEICKPLTNGAFTHQIPPSLNTPNYMPHLLVRGQQLSPRVPQTLPGMHLTTWSQYPRKIASGRHSAPKSTRPSVPQPAKVRNLLTDDLAIARVGSCPYAADTTMIDKLTRRILSTPDPRSRNLNLLTRIKTETSRLSGRSRLSPVESTSPGPRTPAEGTRNWGAGDQLSPYLKTSRVKSEQNTRKLRLARSVQKLSELASDCPPQYAVHINTVSDSSAVLKEEILAILYADVAAAVFAVASGNAAQVVIGFARLTRTLSSLIDDDFLSNSFIKLVALSGALEAEVSAAYSHCPSSGEVQFCFRYTNQPFLARQAFDLNLLEPLR